MELKEFIKETLNDIIDGVREAQQGSSKDVAINPRIKKVSDFTREIQYVEFDIAISELNEDGASGRIGVGVPIIGANGSVSSGKQTEEATRIRFKVGVKFPTVESDRF